MQVQSNKQQQEDVNEVSMLSQGFTGRSPTRDMMNSTFKDTAMASGGIQMAQLLNNNRYQGILEEAENNEMTSTTMQRGWQPTGSIHGGGKKDSAAKISAIEIVPIEFETATKLKLFLESLFQLKPNLLTSYALDKFRIVIEISQEMNNERILKAFISLERTISELNEFGCKVPVLVFIDNLTLSTQQNNQILQLKKKYIMLFKAKTMFEVAKFCKMEKLV